MKNVKKIEIILENCEVIEFEPKDFYDFILDDIKERVSRKGVNCIGVSKTTTLVKFSINKKADRVNKPFGTEMDDPETVFERLSKYNDITGICLTYSDDTEETYYVDYDEGDKEGMLGAPNINQDTYINEYGHLFITICADKKINDLFEEIELKEDIGHWILYN